MVAVSTSERVADRQLRFKPGTREASMQADHPKIMADRAADFCRQQPRSAWPGRCCCRIYKARGSCSATAATRTAQRERAEAHQVRVRKLPRDSLRLGMDCAVDLRFT